MINWRRGWGQSVIKLMLCSGLPCIYCQLEGGDSSAGKFVKFGVVVFKASLLERGSIRHRSMLHHYTSPLPNDHRLLHDYTSSLQIDHRSMLHCYTRDICPRYLCNMLYVKLMWCSGLPCIYWQIYPLSIEHRCLEYYYTKLDRSTGQTWQIYWQIYAPVN